jgi:signal transduction histidine kinase/CheY-like chemotaxis protein
MAHVRSILLITSLASLLVCLAIAIFASRRIANPISVMNEQNIRLAELKEQADLASQTKSSFLANTSHEMRTPLNAVIGLASLALNEENLTPEVREYLEKISNSGVSLLGIINDLLDISKIESGKFELINASYDVPSIINDTVTLNIIRIGSKPIKFKLDINEQLPARLIGDELRLKQIFNNLLSNAFKYTKEGQVSWRLSYEQDDSGTWLVSTVQDTGIGIKAEDLKKLFDDYNQVDTRANRTIEGTGLGLAVVKRLTELMGGDVAVRSIYGQGSEFIVRIPQERDGNSIIGAQAADSLREFQYLDKKRNAGNLLVRASLPNARVLVVDDVSTNLDVAKGMMKSYGMQIVCVMSGIEAIELIREGEKFDAVFMDHMMPEMDGIEAVRIIREEIGTNYARSVPIIALTANAISGNEEMFLDHGFQAFLSKPIDIVKLDSAIRLWIKPNYDPILGAGEPLSNELCSPAPSPIPPAVAPAVAGTPSTTAPAMAPAVQPATAPATAPAAPPAPSLHLEQAFDGSAYGFSVEEALRRFSGDSEVLMDVLRSYSENTPELLDKMSIAASTKDLETYAVTVHGVKGSSRGICAMKLGDEAERLEAAAKAGDETYIEAHNDSFIRKTCIFNDKLKKLIASAQSATTKPKAAEPNRTLIAKIYDACHRFGMDDADEAVSELERYDYQKGNDLVAWLRRMIDKMEFEVITNKLVYQDGVWGVKND